MISMARTDQRISLEELDAMLRAMQPKCVICGHAASRQATVEALLASPWYYCDEHDWADWPKASRREFREERGLRFPPKASWQDLPQALVLRRLKPIIRQIAKRALKASLKIEKDRVKAYKASLQKPKHVRGGNCWASGVKNDVCMKHEEPRGSCTGCPRCPACQGCENCSRLDVPLHEGYCEGCTCRRCQAHGTMNAMGWCSRCESGLAAAFTSGVRP
jgi:hypothetical protein